MTDSNSPCCALCDKNENLKTSHIIPRFVAKWLKQTSATGFLRQATEPNVRVQDVTKLPLLCDECENQLSKFENYFAEKIFFPFHRDRNSRFKYDQSLLKFTISLNWRALTISIENFEKDHPDLASYARRAYKIWKDYLIEKRSDPGEYCHHIFFMDYPLNNQEVIEGFDQYIFRAVDATIVHSRNQVHMYTKLPGIIIVSAIHPKDLAGWKGTKLSIEGEIGSPQEMDWGEFLFSRVKEAFAKDISDEEVKKIVQQMLGNPDRLLESESLQVFLSEHRRKRLERLKSCTKFIQWLVGRLSEGIYSETIEQVALDEMLDILANLSTEEAKRLEKDSTKAAIKTVNTNSDSSSMTRISNSVIVFHFCVDSNHKREIARRLLIQWKDKNYYPTINKVLIIVTDSPRKEWTNFEIGYLPKRI